MSSSIPAASQQKSNNTLLDNFNDGLKLSIHAVTTYRWSFEDDVQRYRQAGIDAIGLWLPKLLEFGEERGAEWLAENGLSVSSLSWVGGFTGAFGYELDDVLRETRQWIRLAGRLRASSLVVVSGPRNNHILRHANRLVVQSLRELADEAAEQDVVLALQPMRPTFARDWTFLHSLDQALDVIARVNHPAVQLAFDTYHLGNEVGLLSRLSEVAPYVGVLQVSDTRESPRGEYDRLLPGEGALPVEAIVSGLFDAGYRGYVDYQIWSEANWRSLDLALLRRCRDNFSGLCPITR